MSGIELPARDFPNCQSDKQAEADLGDPGDTGVGREHEDVYLKIAPAITAGALLEFMSDSFALPYFITFLASSHRVRSVICS